MGDLLGLRIGFGSDAFDLLEDPAQGFGEVFVAVGGPENDAAFRVEGGRGAGNAAAVVEAGIALLDERVGAVVDV